MGYLLNSKEWKAKVSKCRLYIRTIHTTQKCLRYGPTDSTKCISPNGPNGPSTHISEECLMAKALVNASGFVAAQFRAASLVQALIEAETAAARLRGSSPSANKGQSESTGDEETEAAVHSLYNVATCCDHQTMDE